MSQRWGGQLAGRWPFHVMSFHLINHQLWCDEDNFSHSKEHRKKGGNDLCWEIDEVWVKSGELLMVPCLRNLLDVPSIKPVLYGGYAGFHSNSLVYIYDVLSAGISQRDFDSHFLLLSSFSGDNLHLNGNYHRHTPQNNRRYYYLLITIPFPGMNDWQNKSKHWSPLYSSSVLLYYQLSCQCVGAR